MSSLARMRFGALAAWLVLASASTTHAQTSPPLRLRAPFVAMPAELASQNAEAQRGAHASSESPNVVLLSPAERRVRTLTGAGTALLLMGSAMGVGGLAMGSTCRDRSGFEGLTCAIEAAALGFTGGAIGVTGVGLLLGRISARRRAHLVPSLTPNGEVALAFVAYLH